MEKSSKISLKLMLFLFALSFTVIFFFSIGTSPFYGNYYTGDSSIFITIGKAMKQGNIVYKEIFDHKGPILFFIQLIGQYICEGRFGIFILETLFLFISNVFLYKSVCFFTTSKNAILSILVSMIFMSYFIETGNYSEEYSLPFLSICLYIAMKWLKNDSKFSNNIYLYSFIYGICFAIIAFIRINNSALICGIALAITIILIKEKKYKELIKCAVSVLIGIAIICLPIFIYFYKVDAIYDMLYGTFIHNFLYVNSNIPSNTSTVVIIVMTFVLTALLIFNCKKNSNIKYYNLVVILSYLVTLVSINIGLKSYNYYIISVPLIAIFMPPIISIFTSKDMNILIKTFIILYVCLIYTLGCFIPQMYHKLSFPNIGLTNIASFINKNISENDKDKVLAIGLFTAPLYLYGDFMPCYKYAFMQDYLFSSNKELVQETYNYLESRKVKYILYVNLNELPQKNNLQEFIFQNYTPKDSMIFMEANQLKIEPREIILYELK